MDRRRFVKSVGCAGTLAAATHLPVGARDRVDSSALNRLPSAHGMGYVVLGKDKTFAEQVTQENTIYEIRYDFDLEGRNVSVPKKAIFDFRGGSLANGSLVMYNKASYDYDTLFIQAPPYHIFKDKLSIDGEFSSDRISIEWFGAVGDGKTDCTEAFRRALKMCAGTQKRKETDGKETTVEYGKGYTFYLNSNRTYIINGAINYYDGKYNNVQRIAFVGDKAARTEDYPAYKHRPCGIYLKEPNISLFAHAEVSNLRLEDLYITGEWTDWVAANAKIFDNCLVHRLLLKGCNISYIHTLFYETGVWTGSRIQDNQLVGIYNFSFISEAEGKKAFFVDSSIYNNYINGYAPEAKDSSGNFIHPVIDNSFFSWIGCNGSEIHHNFIDCYACMYNCSESTGNVNSSHNHYQVFKYFHKNLTLYSFNDYFNWNDDDAEKIKDTMSRYANRTYTGKDGNTYNVPSYIATDEYCLKNIVIKDAVIEENIKNIVYRVGNVTGAKNPGTKFIISLHDNAPSRSNAIVYKEGADYPVYLEMGSKYELHIDKKLAHVLESFPANLVSGIFGKYGVGEYFLIGTNYYMFKMSYNGSSIVDYNIVPVYDDKYNFLTGSITPNRPVAPIIGQNYFDMTLGRPIWWNGTDWVDATGTKI